MSSTMSEQALPIDLLSCNVLWPQRLDLLQSTKKDHDPPRNHLILRSIPDDTDELFLGICPFLLHEELRCLLHAVAAGG